MVYGVFDQQRSGQVVLASIDTTRGFYGVGVSIAYKDSTFRFIMISCNAGFIKSCPKPTNSLKHTWMV